MRSTGGWYSITSGRDAEALADGVHLNPPQAPDVQLSEENGDGTIDSRDTPDVVFHAVDAEGNVLLAVSGLDGSEL